MSITHSKAIDPSIVHNACCAAVSQHWMAQQNTDYPGDHITRLRCQIENSEIDSGVKFRQKRSWKFDNKELTFGHEGHL